MLILARRTPSDLTVDRGRRSFSGDPVDQGSGGPRQRVGGTAGAGFGGQVVHRRQGRVGECLEKALVSAAVLAAFPSLAPAQQTTIARDAGGVVFVDLLTPADGVTLEELAAELTEAMDAEIRLQPGFRAASVHVARDGAYLLNYTQWDDTASVDAVVAGLETSRLPELAQAFAMSSPEFHPYDVVSVILASE